MWSMAYTLIYFNTAVKGLTDIYAQLPACPRENTDISEAQLHQPMLATMWEAMNSSTFGLLGTGVYVQYNFINKIWLQKILSYKIQKYSINPKIQYNYSKTNYIPELLMANSDGEFLLEWYKYFAKPQVW